MTALLLVFPFSSVCAQTNHAVLSAVAVLTSHVSDTNTHEGVFRFLTDVLKLPVDYGPELHGERRYAAVFAGNMFIEPCGPFSNMRYPANNFKALFFGLNCVSSQSPSSIAGHLGRLDLAYEQAGPNMFRVRDASVAAGIYLAIDTQVPNRAAKDREALLGSALAANQWDGLGFEYVQEVLVGYTELAELQT